MAKRYVLVSESAFKQMSNGGEGGHELAGAPELQFAKYDGGPDHSEYVHMLPKNIQSKARLIIASLKRDLRLDLNGRVLFEGGKVGAHLVDYLRYFALPVAYGPKKPPPDAGAFATLMARNGTPISALGAGRALKRKAGVYSTTAAATTSTEVGDKKQNGGGWISLMK